MISFNIVEEIGLKNESNKQKQKRNSSKKTDMLILLLVYRRHINENTKKYIFYNVCNKIGIKPQQRRSWLKRV